MARAGKNKGGKWGCLPGFYKIFSIGLAMYQNGLYICLPIKNRGVEQLVARRAHNPKVVGSSPAAATKKRAHLEQSGMCFFVYPSISAPN